jgi:hypothetical protein
MKIYADRILINEFPSFRRREGQFLRHLVGINLVQSRGKITVEPVYFPVLSIDDRDGFTQITFGITGPLLDIFLFSKWPYINIMRTNTINLEDE